MKLQIHRFKNGFVIAGLTRDLRRFVYFGLASSGERRRERSVLWVGQSDDIGSFLLQQGGRWFLTKLSTEEGS